MLKIFTKIFGSKYERDVKAYNPNVEIINEFAAQYQNLSHDELRNKTVEFKNRIQEHLKEINSEISTLRQDAEETIDYQVKEDLYKELDDTLKEKDKDLEEFLLTLLPEAFAVIKETSRRFVQNPTITVTTTDHDRDIASRKTHVTIDGNQATWKNEWVAAGGQIKWNMVPYDVQLIGGMVLHDGKIAEMATGEGKTLVATLPAYLNALAGEGVHIVTVNDYLARRDSEWVGPIFEFLMLTCDCIDKHKPHSNERKRAYQSDITYGTNSEFGFDYLRDNMVRSPDEQVQRKHHYCMVDEVDSVLIDDARTPLIISGPVPEGAEEQEYMELRPYVEKLIEAQRKLATQYLTEARKLFNEGKTGPEKGEAGMALLRSYRALPKNRPLIKFLSEEGVKVTLQKAENYYMQEQSKRMHLVDEELYFTIDEKNRQVELTEMGTDYLAKYNSDTNFFILPDIVAEMQAITDNDTLKGDALTEERQRLAQDFSIKSRRLHAISQLLKAYTLFDRDEEYVVLDGQVKIVDEQTGRMMEGRRYSDGLHQALEAKENVKVGEITQTYATVTLQNYFRMYHKLAGMTGTAETEASELWEIYKLDVVVIPTNRPIMREDKEDLVFKTAREKYNTVIDDIVKLTEAGRPVLVGTTSVDISEKLSRMLQLRNLPHNVLNAKQHQREAEIVAEAGLAGRVTIATNMAGRGTDIKLGPGVKEAGGLAIIGTERHDSRRVDRQLRGRSARQGDPGSTQFYVSLEDNLMRLFHSERIAKVMDTMGHKEGEVIQHSMVTKSIERAQKKVEENNFGIRKRLLDYDDVMNIQREAIYRKRKHALEGARLQLDLNTMFMSMAENIVERHKNSNNYEGFVEDSMTILGTIPDIDKNTFEVSQLDDVLENYQEHVGKEYENKRYKIAEILMPLIRNVYENEGHRYKRIAIPYTDGRKHPLPVSADLKEAINTKGKSVMTDIEKAVTLSLIDDHWKEHLRHMDELKESAQAASFEQKDPLVIYKMEAYELFEGLVYKINEDVCAYLSKGKLLIAGPDEVREAREQKTDLSKVRTNRTEEDVRKAAAAAGRRPEAVVETVRREEPKVGRNDPCPCGSGKKYKQCHGR
ncbi:MAG TPA: preprotein translocase subunit SecA [Saprospiraceae bacterium]|nr:preprotein translocase subunit SecA [Saprospiraceae bacterium]